MHRPHPSPPRGAALPLAMILLAVLTVIAAAAVKLSSQERQNAVSWSQADFIQECANAAQAKLWADMAQNGGTAYFGSSISVTDIRLPDGTRFVSPGHYDSMQPRADGTLPTVKDLVVVASQDDAGELSEQDCTNGACGLAAPGRTYSIQAYCVDATGRSLELELAVKFAL